VGEFEGRAKYQQLGGAALMYFRDDTWYLSPTNDTEFWYYSQLSTQAVPIGLWTTDGYDGADAEPPPQSELHEDNGKEAIRVSELAAQKAEIRRLAEQKAALQASVESLQEQEAAYQADVERLAADAQRLADEKVKLEGAVQHLRVSPKKLHGHADGPGYQASAAARLLVFDFDQTISTLHVFKFLAGWGAPHLCRVCFVSDTCPGVPRTIQRRKGLHGVGPNEAHG
jgi:hypothetical protein